MTKPDVSEPSLLSLMRAEYTVSKRWWGAAILLQFAAMLIGFSTNVFISSIWSVWSTAVVLLLSILVYVCKLRFEATYRLAEKVRRLVVLESGLGWKIPPKLQAELKPRFGRAARSAAQKIEEAAEPYYAANVQPGPRRLATDQQESAFLTWNLYMRASDLALVLLAVLLLFLFVAGYAALTSLASLQARVVVAKFVSAFVMFLLTVEVFNIFWKYRGLATEVQRIDDKLEALLCDGGLPSVEDILRVVHEYGCLLLTAPPVPDFLYVRYRDELNDLWQLRLGQQSNETRT